MKLHLQLLTVLMGSIFFIASCGSDSDSDDDISKNDLHGLWEAKSDVGDEGWEYLFFDFDEEMVYFIAYDTKGECYYSVQNDEEIALDGDMLTITKEMGEDNYDITLDGTSLILDDGEGEYEFEFVASDVADDDQCPEEV